MTKKIGVGDSLKELIPVLIFCLAIVVIVCIPLRVMSYGFLPPDDALRHAAKAVSGKSWDQILVLRPEFKMDSHPGWHYILGVIHNATACNQDALVFFSVVFLFCIFCLIPIFFLEYPEAWLLSLLSFFVFTQYLLMRISLGRPFIVTMMVVLVLCFLWPRLKEKKPPIAVMFSLAALVALSTWIHASWYLYAIPVACFFIAREPKAGTRLAITAVIGIAVGALLTGHPFVFLKQTFTHMVLAFNSASAQRLLVGEFQSSSGDPLIVMFVLGLLVYRVAIGKWDAKAVNNPIFILAVTGWALGFIASRFWTDWGLPATLFWVTAEINEAYSRKVDPMQWRRLLVAIGISGALFLAATADINSRWTYNLTVEYLDSADPQYAGWLPEPGGIIYSDDMKIFYRTFFKNPNAPWRYMLGFEPAMMPPEDLAILRKIHWNFESARAFAPWVGKMRPEDRLILSGSYGAKPAIEGLEWHYAATNTWVGRLPRK